MLLAINSLSLPWSSGLVGIYIVYIVTRYPTSWKRFLKPRIWIGLIAVTVLAGLLLGEITNKQSGWTWSGILIGLQMSLRAIFMVVAFNVVSIELRNPKIIGWVLQRGLGQLATAMEVAFDALPTLIASLGEQRNVLRHPVTSLSRLLLVAKQRLTELDLQESPLKESSSLQVIVHLEKQVCSWRLPKNFDNGNVASVEFFRRSCGWTRCESAMMSSTFRLGNVPHCVGMNLMVSALRSVSGYFEITEYGSAVPPLIRLY